MTKRQYVGALVVVTVAGLLGGALSDWVGGTPATAQDAIAEAGEPGSRARTRQAGYAGGGLLFIMIALIGAKWAMELGYGQLEQIAIGLASPICCGFVIPLLLYIGLVRKHGSPILRAREPEPDDASDPESP